MLRELRKLPELLELLVLLELLELLQLPKLPKANRVPVRVLVPFLDPVSGRGRYPGGLRGNLRTPPGEIPSWRCSR
jgi:hypothetical protein